MDCFVMAQALHGKSMSSYMVSKKTMEANAKHSIMTELKNNANADKRDMIVKGLFWLLRHNAAPFWCHPW